MSTPRIVTAPRVRPVFQVAAGDVEVEVGQARYDAARYDEYPDATYAGLDALWSEESCDVIEATTWYGRERTLDTFDVGTATITVANPAGMWDYPPVDPITPLSIRPGRQARVGVAIDDAEPVWLWHGWIDSTQPGYLPAGDRTDTRLDVVTVNCVDAKGEFGRTELPRLVDPVGAGESVVTRLQRIANATAFPVHRRQFDPAGTTLIATQLGGRAGELADSAARSAGGDVYGDSAGMLRYAGRDWQTRGPGEPLDGVIGNRGVDGEVCPNEWEILFARADFSSRINYGRSGEDARTIDDLAAQDLYGVETWDMTNLETETNTELGSLALRAMRVRNFDRAPRIAACRLDAARPGVIELLTAASPFVPSMYACGLIQAGRTVFARTLYLTGIEHTITRSAWTARLALDDAAPWLANADTRYDAANYDVDVYARAP